MKLNEKGFTLVEVLAVIVILSVLMAIMVPTVNHLINKNASDNFEILKDSIKNSAKIYLSDNRYKITLSGPCTNTNDELNITHINGIALTNSQLPISTLIENKDLKTSKGKIIKPDEKNKYLNQEESYVLLKYSCKRKDYTYTLNDSFLKWNE